MNIIIFCAHDSVLCKFTGENVCYLYGLVLSVFRSVALILLSVNVLLVTKDMLFIHNTSYNLQFTSVQSAFAFQFGSSVSATTYQNFTA